MTGGADCRRLPAVVGAPYSAGWGGGRNTLGLLGGSGMPMVTMEYGEKSHG